jgi:hypothetical protein
MNCINIKNNQTIAVSEIPILVYDEFLQINAVETSDLQNLHCVNYFAHN